MADIVLSSELDTLHGSALRAMAAVMLGAVVDMEVKNRRIRKKGLYRVFFWKGDRNILAQPTGKHYPKLLHTQDVNYWDYKELFGFTKG